MQDSSKKTRSNCLPFSAFFLALAAESIPFFYSIYGVSHLSYVRAPYINEIRLVILILGLAGILLGVLSLFSRTRMRSFAIVAIILGLLAVSQHILFCGTDALHQKSILLCPMLWGVMIP